MKKRIIIILCCVGLVIGLCFIFHDSIKDMKYSYDVNCAYSEFKESVPDVDKKDKTTQTFRNAKNKISQIDYNGLYRAVIKYDKSLVGKQELTNNSNATPDFSRYGFYSDSVYGYIYISSLDVRMPVRLGSTDSILNNGAGIINGSSIPIGLSDTHTVIAAHRGWDGSQMFLHIDRLTKGDTVEVDTLFGVYRYEVYEVEYVNNGDVGSLYIQENEQLLTLYTCHPLYVNTQRLLVHCRITE